jgi:hypothetical protein
MVFPGKDDPGAYFPLFHLDRDGEGAEDAEQAGTTHVPT